MEKLFIYTRGLVNSYLNKHKGFKTQNKDNFVSSWLEMLNLRSIVSVEGNESGHSWYIAASNQ